MHEYLHAPGPAHGVHQPFVCRSVLLRYPEALRNAALARVGRRCPGRLLFFAVEAQRDGQHFLAAATQQRERAVRRNLRQRLRVVEIVGEFLPGVLLAVDDLAVDHAMLKQIGTQVLQQRRVFRKAFHQDLPCAVERRLRVGHARVLALLGRECGTNELRRLLFRHQRRVTQQRVGQRLEPGLDSDLCLGAPLRTVRQVQVFKTGFVLGRQDRDLQLRGHLALLLDRRNDRLAPRFQFAQIAQSLFQQAQLDVIQAAGRFLPVACDEGHGCAFIQQRNGCSHLFSTGRQFAGEALFNRRQHRQSTVRRNQ